mmetsp:Transcript_9021/g.29857  ORF Transcript_9021/g.29857 Transcript_9021/m.29857 type:complete len:367 (+) Transcript_9021:56-1156(+)
MSGQVAFGIMGCAGIASKHFRAMQLAGNIRVAACASRSVDKAKAWAKERGIPAAYGSYQALLDDPEVQAVLIPLPTAIRKEWVLKAAAQGKHVLMEKPTAVSEGDLREMVAACRAAGVQLMDCTMFLHHARSRQVAALIADKAAFGEVCAVQSAFMAPMHLGGGMAGDIRTDPAMEPTGALGDMAWYNIRLSLLAFDHLLPTHVTCSAVHIEGGAALCVAGCLFFPPAAGGGGAPAALRGPRAALFQGGYSSHFTAHASIAGDLAVVTMEDFVLEESPDRAEYAITRAALLDDAMIWKRDVETVEVRGCQQEVEMVRTFAGLVLGGAPDWSWARGSLVAQRVLDACAASMARGGGRVDVDQSVVEI